MRLGVIARADNRGLGTQTWEVCRHLDPAKVLVVRVPGSEAQGFAPHLDRFPGATVLTVDEHSWTLPEEEVRAWLEGLDVVYSAETLYDWRIADWGAEQRVATVVHANPEFYLHARRPWPNPSQWWAPTPWRIDHLPDSTVVVPMPAPTDRFPDANPDDDSTSVLHVGGRAATGDRNGTDIVLALTAEQPVHLSSQTPVRRARHAHRSASPDDYWRLYDGHAVLLLPRRYGGLCLPVLEACAASLAPVLTNCSPNEQWPATLIPAGRGPRVRLPGGDIDTHDADPTDALEALRGTLADLPARRHRAHQWAHDNSWEALAPQWWDEFEKATIVKPPKPPSVTVVVPFTPGACCQRDRVWGWVRAYWVRNHPSWTVIEAPGTAEEWSKGAALANVIDDLSCDVVVVADADVVAAREDMVAAVRAVQAGAPWVVPWQNVRRLTEAETETVLSEPPGPVRPEPVGRRRRIYYTGIAGGGLVVLPRKAWDISPMDSRFVGWGLEDEAWGAALDTVVGEHLRLDGDLIHLWHPPQPNREHPSDASVELHRRYINAYRLPRRMAALIADEPFDTQRLTEPVRFRANCRVLKVGAARIEFPDGVAEVSDPDLVSALRSMHDVEEV